MIIRDRNEIDNRKILIMTSIGGSPIHEGHCRVIRDCKKAAYNFHDDDECVKQAYNPEEWFKSNTKLLVVVNCDDFLSRKHGFVFQNEEARAEIIDSIKDVDYTFIHQSDSQSVADAIHYFQPHYFCKGGDRSDISTLPESERSAMQNYGVVFVGGVGGNEKVSSSSDLMSRVANHYFYHKPYKEWLKDENKYQFKDLMTTTEHYPKETLSERIDWFTGCIDRLTDGKFY